MAFEPLIKGINRIENGRQEEVQQTPKLGQVIHEGSSRQKDTMFGFLLRRQCPANLEAAFFMRCPSSTMAYLPPIQASIGSSLAVNDTQQR
jgi:hypothetical protein